MNDETRNCASLPNELGAVKPEVAAAPAKATASPTLMAVATAQPTGQDRAVCPGVLPSDSAATSATTEGSVAVPPQGGAPMVPSTPGKPVRMCRKCSGPCPPCKPWRCKQQTSGRSLAELEKTMPATPTSPMRSTMPPSMRRSNSYRSSGAPTTENIESALSQLNVGEEDDNRGMPKFSRSQSAPQYQGGVAGGGRWKSNAQNRYNNHRDQFSPTYGYQQAGGYIPNFADNASLPPPMPRSQETSHVFLAIAADKPLIQYCDTIQKGVVEMPEIPEINSLDDSRCIWPHTVHLTIHSFGKVLNEDIPRIAEYCKANINVIEPFDLNIGGLFHHQKLYTVGFKVEKWTVEPLRQMKSNMQAWFNKGNNWDGFTPIFSVLRTQTPRGARFSCQPLSSTSIDEIIKKYGSVKYVQRVNPADIQLCLARSSTETTFYKNLLLPENAMPAQPASS